MSGKLGKILVTGCMTQRYGEDVSIELPEVDGILGTGSYKDITAAVEAAVSGEHPRYFGDINAPVASVRSSPRFWRIPEK